MLYKGYSDAARPPEGGSAEAEGLSASNLPLNIDRLAQMPDSLLKSLCMKHSSWLKNVDMPLKTRNQTNFMWPLFDNNVWLEHMNLITSGVALFYKMSLQKPKYGH